LEVYQRAFEAAMRIFELSKAFPREETYALTDQIRRSSRSVCANVAEAWRKRRYPKAFISKLSDAEGEAAETQTWIEFAVRCGYIDRETGAQLYQTYDSIVRTLVGMIMHHKTWIIPDTEQAIREATESYTVEATDDDVEGESPFL
jgi:four helix bundle protein